MNKEKYKDDFRAAGEGTVDDLLPVIRKTISSIFGIFQEILNDAISEFMDKKVKSKLKTKKRRNVKHEG